MGKAKGIESLCRWTQVDTAQGVRQLKLGSLFSRAGLGKQCEILFDEVPTLCVHRGDVALRASLLLDAKGHGVFVIDGDLRVDGTLTFSAVDAYTVLVITGDLTASHFQQARDTQLFVLGTTRIDGVLHVDVSDAGVTVFRGPVAAADLVIRDNGVESGLPMFARPPKGKKRAPEWSKEVVRRVGANADPVDLHQCLVAGLELFAPEPAVAVKLPSKAALERMTIEQCLLLRGFEEMQFEKTVNPNYWKKGRAGQSLKRLSLMNDTLVREFPPALSELVSLKLLMFREKSSLLSLLRSLPRLAQLTELRLVSTPLTEVPEVVQSLEHLEALELRDNQLTTLPTWLADLPKLKTLVVNEPHLKRWPAALKRFQSA